jgi:hypothetical protein
MKNPVDKYVNRISGKFTSLAEELSREMIRYVKRVRLVGPDIENYIREFLQKKGVPAEIEKAMMQAVYGGLSAGAGAATVSLGVKRWYEENAVTAGDKVFSTIRKASRMPELAQTLSNGLRAAQGLRTTAQAITDKAMVIGDVAKDVKDLSQLARAVAVRTNDPH